MSWPVDVGILALELYFPRFCVRQADLEQYDRVSAGKYTVGLGQEVMGFCNELEDVNSICLTVTKRLMENYQMDPRDFGRLEVGTETLVDKSKSVKTVLMSLFEESGNLSLEGVDTSNACFGGTQAVFNAVNWVESSSWDGRLALVVMGDLAVYAEGVGRCTGGAGALALVVGPGAPLVFDRRLRALHVRHVYDFYKPDMSSEYPTFDSKLSIQSYLSALDATYQLYQEKVEKNYGESVSLKSFDGVLFHSPYCKLVRKSLARLAFHDFRRSDRKNKTKCQSSDAEQILEEKKTCRLESTFFDRELEKACLTFSEETFQKKTKPSLLFARNVGNMYTPSLYGCLASFLLSRPLSELPGSRLLLFSYGSGLASAMFSVTLSSEPSDSLRQIRNRMEAAQAALDDRIFESPSEFTKILKRCESVRKQAPFEPEKDPGLLFPGVYYLEKIDGKYRRTYARSEVFQENGLKF